MNTLDGIEQLEARIIIRPFFGPSEGIDVTDAMVNAVAAEIWKRYGGNEVMNWLEAQILLNNAMRVAFDREKDAPNRPRPAVAHESSTADRPQTELHTRRHVAAK